MPVFIEKKFKLQVNRSKSAVDRPWQRKFLGFNFTANKELKIRIVKESIQKMKDKKKKNQYLTRTLETPFGVPKGSKVYGYVMNIYVIYLN